MCGCPPTSSCPSPRRCASNSGRERTSAICYAVGWTHHTVGVQIIRAAAIVQLLLGNIGRPGGGILALRGHASIQGSTDIPTLYNILPGYIPMPHAHAHGRLERFLELNTSPSGFWGNMPPTRRACSRRGGASTPHADNDFCFDYLPRLTGDHSIYPAVLGMLDGDVHGFFVLGENPAVGSANSRPASPGDGRRSTGSSCATWWRPRRRRSGATRPRSRPASSAREDIGTEVFFMPAAAHTEKDGSFTNTQRLLQWRHKAVEPPGDCRSELWFMYHLGRIIREKLAGSTDPLDGRCSDLSGTTRPPAPRPIRAPTRCCARSTAGARTGRRCRRTRS